MIHKQLVALLVVLAAAGSVSAQSVRAGIEAWQQADYTRAVAIWRPLAEKGDPDAQFNLGQAYRLGRGVPINIGAATIWFERSAKQGHIDAETTLGLLLFQNGDRSNGVKWLKEAADRNEPRAELVYGTALVNGDGVARDPVLGYSYVSRSAAQGLAPAKDTLAQLNSILKPEQREKGAAIALAQEKPVPVKGSKRTRETAKPRAVALAGPKAPAKAAPAQPSKAEAPESIQAHGDWRIQLGAFSKRSSAETLYRTLSGKRALSGRSAFYTSAGAITRLQVGPFESKDSAAQACRALGVPCFPVPAK